MNAYLSSVISISLVLLLVGVASILLLNARSVSDYFVHLRGFVLAGVFVDRPYPGRYRPLAELYCQLVTLLDLVGGAGDLAVDLDAVGVACLVGDGAALDDAGDLEEFVKSHYIYGKVNRESG